MCFYLRACTYLLNFPLSFYSYQNIICQVDAMKLGVKEMKKEYKKVNIDEIEVSQVTTIKNWKHLKKSCFTYLV